MMKPAESLTTASLMIIITVTVEFDLKCQMISSDLKTTFAFNILLSVDTSSEKIAQLKAHETLSVILDHVFLAGKKSKNFHTFDPSGKPSCMAQWHAVDD